jgi:hypothetical protein
MARRRSSVSLLAILVLVHLYIGLRLLPGMEVGILGTLVGTILLALSAVLVRIGLVAPSLRRSRWSGPLAWTGLLAMGFFSSLLVLTLARDVLLLILKLTGAVGPALVRDSAVAVPLLALAVTAIGFINARRLARVVRVDVPIAGLPQALGG